MAAYMLFIREEPVRDPKEMAEYRRLNQENAGKIKVSRKPLIVYGAMEAIEGKAPDGIILLQFSTVADAKTWYDSPEYQTALPHRKKAADYRAIIVEGV